MNYQKTTKTKTKTTIITKISLLQTIGETNLSMLMSCCKTKPSAQNVINNFDGCSCGESARLSRDEKAENGFPELTLQVMYPYHL